LMAPDNPLPGHYKWVPIAYHGRASLRACHGNTRSAAARPARSDGDQRACFWVHRIRLDFELEWGFTLVREIPLGEPIPI